MNIRGALSVAFALALSAPSAAQDAGAKTPNFANRFADSLQITGNKKPAAIQDPRLATAFVNRIAQCYQLETQKPLAAADRALLVEYAPELIVQFQAGLRTTGCDPTMPATATCLEKLAKLDCEPLAQVVRDNRWDRALSPEMEKSIAKYTTKLAARYQACQNGDAPENEESKIRSDYTAHSSTVQVSMLLTTGQCSLEMPKLDRCLARIDAPDACKSLQEHAKHSRLPRYCSEFLDCSAEPALVGNITK